MTWPEAVAKCAEAFAVVGVMACFAYILIRG